jgi:hypothetical protein
MISLNMLSGPKVPYSLIVTVVFWRRRRGR